MKKYTLLIALTCIVQFAAISQSCLPQDFKFTTQAQIDNFQTNYPNCTEIDGNLIIRGDNITNLDSLNVLTSIEGDLDIGGCFQFLSGNPSLTSLSGLANLKNVGGSLLICQNHILNSLDGLDNITQVEGRLYIYHNSNLINISALGNLTDLGGSLMVESNQALLDLTGLEGLENIDGTLEVWFNNSLVDLTGLDNISSIGGNLEIEGNEILNSLEGLESLSYVAGNVIIGCIYGWLHPNPSIKSLSGLDNLSTIGGSLWINLNVNLLNLIGLENLTNIGESITIENNPVLADLTGLENIEPGSINGLYISHNDLLSGCAVQSICDYLVSPNGTISIFDNAPGCNSQEEVKAACAFSVDEKPVHGNLSIYPNPFSTSTTIQYELAKPSTVQFTIYDYLGKKLEVIEKKQTQGKQQITWNAEGLPAGVYFCVIKTNQGIETTKLIKL